MNIICTIDDAYAQHCGVMLTSLFANNARVAFRVFLLTDGLRQVSAERLTDVARAHGQRIEWCPVDARALGEVRVTAHVSLATYFRLLIPTILPADVDKALFLDSDIVVRGPIGELYDTVVDDYTHAAVENPLCRGELVRLGRPAGEAYFNAGVLVLNLRRWRDERFSETLLAYADAHADQLQWWDQDVLNATLAGRWLPCSPIWNAQEAHFMRYSAEKLGITAHELQEVRMNPRIVHFTGSQKPWNHGFRHPYKRDYETYLAETPWKNSRPARQTLADSFVTRLALRLVPTSLKRGCRRLASAIRPSRATC